MTCSGTSLYSGGSIKNLSIQINLETSFFLHVRCGHCKRLAPEYEIAATALLDSDPPIPLAKVDCPANTQLCSEFGVSGYPTLKIFRDGELSGDYSGPRDAGETLPSDSTLQSIVTFF